ncbi:MAG: hypothetical protein LBH18_02075 [Spirochaetaceae bacterium]|jgi:hypothetical protein|nr:hypothetical protein [Spirochaetaceae bacterium]
MMRCKYCLFIAVFSILFAASCKEAADFLEQPENKSIVITDSDSTWPTLMRELDGKPVFLGLLDGMPDVNALSTSDMMEFIYSIGEITSNKIDFRLYIEKTKYWTGYGDYWVILAVMNRPATRILQVYISKRRFHFYLEQTYVTNADFTAPIYVDIEVDSVLPF